jgi:hypothetical protein
LKTQTVKVVTKEDYIDHLLGVVNSNHKSTATGIRRGGIRITAEQYGLPETEISNALNSGRNPSRRILAHDGLVPVTFYVRKQ